MKCRRNIWTKIGRKAAEKVASDGPREGMEIENQTCTMMFGIYEWL
jgi:hypothetical protein